MASKLKYSCLVVSILVQLIFVHTFTEDVESDDLSSLELVHIIFRHGDRTPVEPYPNDPYKNVSLWPVGWGQLTNEGKRQHYHLGQFFRRRYGNFLSSKYLKEEIHIRSTDVDRTLMSAESNLAGLYPPEGGQIWEPGITWQPIPIHTLPEAMDEVLAGKKPCSRYEEEAKKAKQSPEIRKLNEKNRKLYEYLTEKSGKHIHDLTSVEYLYNTLTIEKKFNFTLPSWTKSVYPDKMENLASHSFTLSAYTKEMQRLKMGPLLGEMLDHFLKKREGTLSPPQRKLFIYSGHDTTIANMLMTLGVFDPPFNPPYTATILLELHHSTNDDHYVSLLYKNGTGSQKLIPLTIPGCLQLCPLDRFSELINPVIPIDWKSECERHFEDNMAADPDIFSPSANLQLPDLAIIALITSATTALLLIMAIAAIVVYWCRRRDLPHWYFRLNTEGP